MQVVVVKNPTIKFYKSIKAKPINVLSNKTVIKLAKGVADSYSQRYNILQLTQLWRDAIREIIE